MKYIFNKNTKKFEELEFPIDNKVLYYINCKGLTINEIKELRSKFGQNEFIIPLPKFWDIFQEHATAPFFLFQIFCVGLWCLDEYVYYSLFTLFMLCIFEMMMVKRRMGNMKLVRNMRAKPIPIHIFRDNKWLRLMSNDVYPGDIVSIARGKITKDEDIYNITNQKLHFIDTIVPNIDENEEWKVFETGAYGRSYLVSNYGRIKAKYPKSNMEKLKPHHLMTPLLAETILPKILDFLRVMISLLLVMVQT